MRLNVSRLLEERERWIEKERTTGGKGEQQADESGGGRGDAPVVKSARTPLRPNGQFCYCDVMGATHGTHENHMFYSY